MGKRGRKPKHQPQALSNEIEPQIELLTSTPLLVNEIIVPEPQTQSISPETKPRKIKRAKKSANQLSKASENRQKESLAELDTKPIQDQEVGTSEIQDRTKPPKIKRTKKSAKSQHIH